MSEEKTEVELGAEAEVVAEAAMLARAEAEEEERAEAQLVADEDVEEEPTSLAVAGEGGEEDPPKKGSYQERINALTYKYRSAERELDYYKNLVLDKNKSGGTGLEPPPANVKAGTGTPGTARPKTGDFETVEDYEDALHNWYDADRAGKEATEANEAGRRKLLSAFNEGAAPLRLEHPDFDEIVDRPVFTDSMRKAIFNLDNGPLVAYELGKNPELAEKIKSLSPDKQIYEMGKLEHKLILVRKVSKGSKTPNPIRPLTGRTKKDVDPNDMSINDWMEWEKNQQRAKLRAKLGIKE